MHSPAASIVRSHAASRMVLRGAALVIAMSLAIGVFGTGTAFAATDDASQAVGDVNAARLGSGISTLTQARDLDQVALAQAQRMATEQRLYHNPNLATDVTGWQTVGENVGVGPDVATIDDAFYGSAPHRANILDTRYGEIGIGMVRTGDTLWIAQVFRQPKVAALVATPAPSAAAAPASSTPAPAPAVRPTATKAGRSVDAPAPAAAQSPTQVAAIATAPSLSPVDAAGLSGVAASWPAESTSAITARGQRLAPAGRALVLAAASTRLGGAAKHVRPMSAGAVGAIAALVLVAVAIAALGTTGIVARRTPHFA